MSSAAVLVTASPLQVALQTPPDAAAPVAADGGFIAAMAAACVTDPEAGIPEGMQSAAALAWLAGFMSSVQPAQTDPPLQPEAGLLTETGQFTGAADIPVADARDSSEESAVAALGILQEWLQPAVHNLQRGAVMPGDSSLESVELPVVISAAGDRAEAIASEFVWNVGAANVAASVAASLQADAPVDSEVTPTGVLPTGDTPAEAISNSTQVAAPLAAMRTLTVNAQPVVVAPAQGNPRSGLLVNADSSATSNTPLEASVGERLIGALAERVSMRTEGSSIPADLDRSAVAGPNPNLYTSTRDAVSSAAGQVSNRPEVVHATVGSPRWANELGSRLAMMSVRGQHEGSLSLSPEHLGPLEVRISVNQDRTDVWFGAQNADTRAALADAIPRLREMFAASGLALGNAGVSHEMPGQEARQGEASAMQSESRSESAEAPAARVARISAGLLDTWA